jgi:hypothetical protein
LDLDIHEGLKGRFHILLFGTKLRCHQPDAGVGEGHWGLSVMPCCDPVSIIRSKTRVIDRVAIFVYEHDLLGGTLDQQLSDLGQANRNIISNPSYDAGGAVVAQHRQWQTQ